AVVRRFTSLAESKTIEFVVDLSADIPPMLFDHELVGRMLANLVGNALKYTPAGLRVRIRTEYLEKFQTENGPEIPCALIAVKDMGEGIPKDYHKRIFEKFGQVETRKAGLEMSTGLGLALCLYVVEAHGGKIWVESTPGKGAKFFVALPISPGTVPGAR
ncbi:MAG: HAMP domain-containing sensor histidine kinase, partial [Pseudomonadota bacterium]